MPPPFKVTLKAHEMACERGGRILFEALSFNLSPGEALLVNGPNGVGKTSLLRQVAGLLPLAAGEFEATGSEGETPIAELCHYVGHLNAAKNALTVRENLVFWGQFLSAEGGDPAGALRAFGLDQLTEVPAGLLSAGQKRKLALSRLFAAPRPLWLLDEPSVSLDAASVDRLTQSVHDHLKAGGIAIVTTHVPLAIAFTHELTLEPAPERVLNEEAGA